MAPSIACVVPCHNEEAAIGQIVRDLREALSTATIYVRQFYSEAGGRAWSPTEASHAHGRQAL